jgi:voltage-gated potassium channel
VSTDDGRRRRPGESGSRLQARIAKAVATRRVFPWLAGVTAFIAVSTGIIVRAIDHRDFHSVGDGIWWSIVTLATVGYGDIVPTTTWGRVIGSLVIVFGVTFLAFLTATVTSLFVSSEQQEAAAKERELMSRGEEQILATLKRLDERVASIEAKLDDGS